jgi:hypothetical protein
LRNGSAELAPKEIEIREAPTALVGVAAALEANK